jgi:homoaconitate hydratase
MPQNYIEKIAQKYAVNLEPNAEIHSGEIISVRPAYVMTHDNTGAVIPKFKSIGATKYFNPRQVVNTLDHNIQDKSPKNLDKYKRIEEFATSMGADFYPAGRGIGHQIMCEEGYVLPGTFVVASDSHSNMYGGLGALGTPVVRTDAAAIWATGQTWWQIPPVAKVELLGELRDGVYGKDVIIALSGLFNNDEVLNHAIEFTGEGVKHLSLDQRLTIANMTTEWGALAGVFPVDEITIAWLKERAAYIKDRGLEGVNSDSDSINGEHPRLNSKRISEIENDIPQLQPDKDAFYAKEISLDLSTIEPVICGPHTVKKMHTVEEVKPQKIKIDKAYLVSCVNSRLEDIKAAAETIGERKVNSGVKFYVAAASRDVQKEAEKQGYWQTLLNAGAIPLPPGCGPCIGLGAGLLEDGEVGISATNRNFKGRMGSPNAEAYLASPAVVADSAINGFISDNVKISHTEMKRSIKINDVKPAEVQKVTILDGFPKQISGKVLFCNVDNMNTDGIYPGKYTYNDDFTPEQQAEVAMENYDPAFQKIAEEGDILVSGFNFGTGSSREQAATSLKYRGIQLVIAASFSATYLRNALNNGFLGIVQPDLVKYLRKSHQENEELTLKIEEPLIIDFENSVILFNNQKFVFPQVGIAAQELVLSGGLENWVKERI